MKQHKQRHILCILAASAALAGCSSAGEGLADAITDPLKPKANGNYKELGFKPSLSNTLLPDSQSSITITDDEKQGAELSKTYRSGDKFDIGFKKQDLITELAYERKTGSGSTDGGKLLLYKQNYSAVVGLVPTHAKDAAGNNRPDVVNKLEIASIQGQRATNIPQTGTANYKGSAFAEAGYGKKDYGKLDYTVDFASKTGQGSITGLLGKQDITIEQAQLNARPDGSDGFEGFEGHAKSKDFGDGRYSLGLYGPEAAEIAGGVNFRDANQSIGMAGKKQ